MTAGEHPIRTLIVDDDFRVAEIHATSVERIDGFVCIGKARTAAQARDLIENERPDLVLLDIYLPDEGGLSLLRSLTGAGAAPDCIFITAARDLESVRSAMSLGAMSYLVKPFGFSQLKDKLDSYQRWRAQVASAALGSEADQGTVDALYDTLRGSVSGGATPRLLPPTMAKILHAVEQADGPVGASSIASTLGFSRPTAQRYLTELHRRGALELELAYGATGRPVNLYRPARRS
ncbi:MAG: two-component system response regulator [Pseudonocardiales bacterium]|nr:MAG: two-component system response regulator [Pseudonocardiales bacterium]